MNRVHGESTGGILTPEFMAWRAMKFRCTNPHAVQWKNYGGRGITICDRWQTFANFLTDMGRRPGARYSLDRIDVNGNYEPSNCRWATTYQQAHNKRNSRMITFGAKTQTIAQWGYEIGLSPQAIRYRLKTGWSVEEALTAPKAPGNPYGHRKEASTQPMAAEVISEMA